MSFISKENFIFIIDTSSFNLIFQQKKAYYNVKNTSYFSLKYTHKISNVYKLYAFYIEIRHHLNSI